MSDFAQFDFLLNPCFLVKDVDDLVFYCCVTHTHMLNTCDKPSRIIMTMVALVLISLIIAYYYSVEANISIYAQEVLLSNSKVEPGDPYVTDPNFTVYTVAAGFELPTDMAFLSDDVILVLEKNIGTVRKVVN
jgi:hypothetical protein